MKNKILSVLLMFCIIFSCTCVKFSVLASTSDYDELAINKGYVCRIGDAEAAYAEGNFSGYCETFYMALDRVQANNTITFIQDVDLSPTDKVEKISLSGKGNITICGAEGKNITITRNGNFAVESQTVTFKNINIVLDVEKTSFGSVSGSGKIIYENCSFTTDKKVSYGYFILSGGTVNFTDCVFNITPSEAGSDNSCLFYGQKGTAAVNMVRTHIDISDVASSYYGANLTAGGSVNMIDSSLKTANTAIKISGSSTAIVEISGVSCVNSASSAAIDLSDVSGTAGRVAVSDRSQVSSVGVGINIGQASVSVNISDNAKILSNVPLSINDSNTSATVVVKGNATVGESDEIIAPKLEYGASVRTVEKSNGIRFTSTVDTAKISAAEEYGILIVKYDELLSSGVDFTLEAMTGKLTFGKIAAETVTQGEDGVTTYNLAMTGLPTDQLCTNFAVRGYAIYKIGGARVTVYSQFDEEANVRSMKGVAEAAIADVKTAEEIAANSELAAYKYEVQTGKYSRYSKAQYETILKIYANTMEEGI